MDEIQFSMVIQVNRFVFSLTKRLLACGLSTLALLSTNWHCSAQTQSGKKKLENDITCLFESSIGGQIRIIISANRKAIYVRGKLGDLLIQEEESAKPLLLNPDNKTVFEDDTYSIGRTAEVNIAGCLLQGSGKLAYKGMSCNSYSLLQPRSKNSQTLVTVGKVFFTRDLGLSLSATDKLCRAIAVHTGRGLPVYIELSPAYKEADGKLFKESSDFLKLIELKKIEAVPERFKIPKGYRKAQCFTEFVFSENGKLKKEDIEELFQQPL